METVMLWLMTSKAGKAAVIALMLGSCGAACGSDTGLQVNRPLAQAEVASRADLQRVSEIVAAFARKNRFAVQEAAVSRGVGKEEFSIRLFRDDISVTVDRTFGETIGVAAFPLCVCELGKRQGLQTASDAAVSELKENLSRG